MKTLGKLLLLGALFTFLFISCSKDEPSSTTGPDFSISDMAGNWEATKASLYNSTIDHGVAIIADDGTVSMVIQANGRFTINIDPIDRNPFTVTGKMFFE